MSNLLHVCLYNTDPAASEELVAAIHGLNFVRLVGEASTPEELASAIHQANVNLVFFHLDPKPAAVIGVIDQVATRHPDVAMIALSHKTGPEAILAPLRAGCDQFVCEPIDQADLASAVGRVASKRLSAHPHSRCICVTGASGGTGATSIACNLALEIALATDRTCALVDLDDQFGDVALYYDCEPKYTIYDLIVNDGELDRAILSSTLTHLPCNVAVLARPRLLEQCELVTADAVHRVVESLMRHYENIVIDVPNRLSPASSAAMSLADPVLIVCQLLVPSLRNAKRYHDALKLIGIPDSRIESVVNRSDGRTGRVTAKDLEETIGKPIFASVPNDYQFVARSIDFGRPVASLDRSSPVRAAIRDMAQKLTANPADAAAAGGRRGFLSRLLAK